MLSMRSEMIYDLEMILRDLGDMDDEDEVYNITGEDHWVQELYGKPIPGRTVYDENWDEEEAIVKCKVLKPILQEVLDKARNAPDDWIYDTYISQGWCSLQNSLMLYTK